MQIGVSHCFGLWVKEYISNTNKGKINKMNRELERLIMHIQKKQQQKKQKQKNKCNHTCSKTNESRVTYGSI